MTLDIRLTRMLHILVHLGIDGAKRSSVELAAMLQTNPTVIRRTMGLLRERGIVSSEQGRAGGWRLIKRLEDITVLEVQNALGPKPILEVPISRDHENCATEVAANKAVEDAFAAGEQAIRERFAMSTLSAIAEAVLRRPPIA